MDLLYVIENPLVIGIVDPVKHFKTAHLLSCLLHLNLIYSITENAKELRSFVLARYKPTLDDTNLKNCFKYKN